jgi:hypothetical protein
MRFNRLNCDFGGENENENDDASDNESNRDSDDQKSESSITMPCHSSSSKPNMLY